ncbi:hypothetical protein CWI38_0209p0020 [Hamiltosporidium tvaerminnensis]|uniref:Uncharacterized protein n=1 Tax=Hamiltosporidium tvaerminnensis TaxID=1176355 RepID=A0A4Q9M1A4_9MICR|nr:hypothetical protein CWI38_0209p0020 [Hamiltosporidium tvaerminnensis]
MKYKENDLYDLVANELGFIYKCSFEIISYSIVLNKTVETISFDRRRGLEASMCVVMRAEMHEKPTSLLKQASREENDKESELEEETTLVKRVEENA